MTITTLSEYKQEADKDRENWLGQMVIFSVSDCLVQHEELKTKLTVGGLEDFVPAEPKDENVFRRVWTNRQRATVATDDSEVVEHILMRELERRNGLITKRIVIETVDLRGQRLGYDEVIEARFHTSNPHLVNIRPIGRHHAEAWALAIKLRDEYLAEKGCVDSNAVRDIVRRVLESCLATVLRPGGGVYFVENKHLSKIEALESASEIIPGCVVHTVPIVDTEKQRSNLKRAFESESQEELERLLREMTEIVKGTEEITAAKAASFANERKRAKEKMMAYQALLADGLDTVEAKLEMFDVVYVRMLNKVKA